VRRILHWHKSAAAVIAVTMVLGAVAFAQQGKKKEAAAAPGPGTPVVLTKRKDNGPYGTSAYSFRYMSQDVAVHKNDVDLVYNNCGLLHVAPQGGLKNRIAKVKGMAITDAITFPEQNWLTTAVEPEKDGVYVMEVDDGTTHLRVRIHISSVSDTELHLEWMPFRDASKGSSGTLGACSGKHGAN